MGFVGRMKTFALAASLIAMLVLAVWGAIYVWNDIGGIEMSTAGILAMIAGIVLSLGLGMGLMFLVFKSERDGEDRG
jgi:uncharacterized membrane protein HdeD (DUF308 family)